MKKYVLLPSFIFLFGILPVFAQMSLNQYESEFVMNPNKGRKDTREVNAILMFEKDSLKIVSRRSSTIFKEFKYADINFVEHSYSKNYLASNATKAILMMALTGLPIWFEQKEKHWLTILAENDFAVLKIENDNYRLIKNEFLVRKLDIDDINEDR